MPRPSPHRPPSPPFTLTAMLIAAMSACVSSAPDRPHVLAFADITAWTYTDGLRGMPPELLARSGTRVTLHGMLLPIDADVTLPCDPNAPWLTLPCQDGPQTNSFVRVVLPPGTARPVKAGVITCTGTFVVSATIVGGECADVYQLHADRVDAVK